MLELKRLQWTLMLTLAVVVVFTAFYSRELTQIASQAISHGAFADTAARRWTQGKDGDPDPLSSHQDTHSASHTDTDLASLSSHQDTDLASLSSHQDTDLASLSYLKDTDLASLSSHQDTDLASLSSHQGTDLASLSSHQDTDLASLFSHQDTGLASLSSHQGTHLASLFSHQDTDLASLSSHQDTHLASLPSHQDTHLASLSTHRDTALPSLSLPSHQGLPESAAAPQRHVLTERQVADRFQARRERLSHSCKRFSQSRGFRFRPANWSDKLSTLSLNSTEGTVVKSYYCLITKVSSTTWIRDGIISSVLHASNSSVLTRGVVRTRTEDGQRNVSFTFVREPYGRLLSAYVNKLLLPDNTYWTIVGQYVTANLRPNASKHSLQCGHDVTFPEIIKYFLNMYMPRTNHNVHFVPIHHQCAICDFPYKFIGHLETFSEDTAYILKAMGSTFTYPNVQFPNDTIWDSIRKLSKWGKKVLTCIDMNQALRRVWKTLQIRGLISKRQSFPLTKRQTLNITKEQFLEVLLAAHANSGDLKQLKAQKKEAMLEAFSSVPLADRMRVKERVSPQFHMFGYDPEPQEVFPKFPYRPDPNFSYFDWRK